MLYLCVAAQLAAQPVMRAHFLPVGQAHSTLLEFSCGAALIDAGAQDAKAAARLLAYLDRFFERRTDLNKTLDLVLITHNHIDHTQALREVAERFTVRVYVDNGQLTGTGTADPKWIRANAAAKNIQVREVAFSQIEALPDIDPINCADADPKIRALWGRVEPRPAGWSKKDKNNHSIVTRIDFGEASFLFTGDLEEKGLEKMLAHYAREVLDADVYQVGHHGSHNATTQALLDAVTPELAVIPVGSWDSGKDSGGRFNTFSYGHPRKVTLDLLTGAIAGDRPAPVTVMAAAGSRMFVPYVVTKAIYATAWDGVVKVEATVGGQFTVTLEQ